MSVQIQMVHDFSSSQRTPQNRFRYCPVNMNGTLHLIGVVRHIQPPPEVVTPNRAKQILGVELCKVPVIWTVAEVAIQNLAAALPKC